MHVLFMLTIQGAAGIVGACYLQLEVHRMTLKKEDKNALIRMLSLFKQHTGKIIFIFICIIFSSLIGVVFPLLSKNMMDQGLVAGNMSLVVRLSLFILVLTVVNEAIGFVQALYLAKLNSLVTYTLERDAFRKILRLKMSYFKNTNFSEIMNNINMDIRNLSRITDQSTFFILSEVFRMVSGVVGLLMISWKITVIIILLLPLRYIASKYLAKRRRNMFEKFMEYSRDYSSWYGDIITGIKEIKLWCMDRVKSGEFIKKQRILMKSNIRMAMVDRINMASEKILYQVITNLIYIVGAYLIFGESLTIGGLFALVTYSVYVTGPVSVILNIGYNFANILPAAKRLFGFLDMEEEDYITTRKLKRLDVGSTRGHFRFEHVSFSYHPDSPVLKDMSFEILPGEKVALVGLNGAGKSTVVNLLLRFNKPDKGKIYLDGVDINEINLRDYRRLISVVSQDIYLFNTSIGSNISANARFDLKKIHKAAVKSGAYEFIKALPQKYDSKVGSNGAALSGGQRQKLSVARAFAKKSRILILDEPTAFYDAKSEVSLNNILQHECKNETVLVISHNTDILRRVDRILILGNGCIADEGKYDDLYKKNAFFRNVVDSRDAGKNAG